MDPLKFNIVTILLTKFEILEIKTVFAMDFVFEVICHQRRILIVKDAIFIWNKN